ncbi:MAG: filamentous hemagglutinin N-terminal domain-containing protein [Pseudomonadota bacterium]
MKHPIRLTWFCAALAVHGAACAQIRTDASLGQAARNLTGPDYRIPEALGKLAGNNLFHSFERFNIGAGESATFTTRTPGIANVVSRVTGGEASYIGGTLGLSAASGRPAFFFINPAGVTFGAGAEIDVPGAFHVATADYLQFPDGALRADLKQASTFSSAAPEAFGFLGTRRATIAILDGAALVPRIGRALTVAAGDIVVDNALAGAVGAEARLAAVGGPALVLKLDGAMPALAGDLSVSHNGLLAVAARDGLDGGKLTLGAGTMTVSASTIVSTVAENISGNGGMLEMNAASSLRVTDGGIVHSGTKGSGNGGAILLRAQDIAINGGAEVTSAAESSGAGGAVALAAGGALLLSGATVRTYSDGPGASGAAGALRLSGGSVALDGATSVYSASFGTGQAGNIDIVTPGRFTLDGASSIGNTTVVAASGTVLRVDARDIALGGDSLLFSTGFGAGSRTGDIALGATASFTMNGAAKVASYGLNGGSGGQIRLTAHDITLDGSGSTIASGSSDGSGSAGSIVLGAAGTLAIVNDASVASGTYNEFGSGAISLSANSIRLDNGHVSTAALAGSGNGGAIDIAAQGALDMVNGSAIASTSTSRGNAGNVRIAAGSMSMSSLASINTAAFAANAGHAGDIDIVVRDKLSVVGTGSADETTFIDSSTASSNNAGTITIKAGDIVIDRNGSISSVAFLNSGGGNAGTIDLQAAGQMVFSNEGHVFTSTLAGGDAGIVRLRAGSLTMTNGSVHSDAPPGSAGNAGGIEVQVAGALTMTDSNLSTSAGTGAGRAGSVRVSAQRVVIDGAASSINASAQPGSIGQTGSVDIVASESIALSGGTQIRIENNTSVANPGALQPTRITLAAPQITLDQARISAAASGNVAASDIAVSAAGRLSLTGSTISTSANLGNGGAVALDGGRLLVLNDTQLTTSVLGSSGNGGNIRIGADALLLNTGFIQANTAAANASGGLVAIDAGALVASGSTLFVGGATPHAFVPGVFGYNVIQAAAPTGVSGTIAMSSPVLDVSGSLSGLNARVIDGGGLGRDPCQASAGSSLAPGGRGGLAPSARGLLGAPSSAASIAPAGAQMRGGAPAIALAQAGGCR